MKTLSDSQWKELTKKVKDVTMPMKLVARCSVANNVSIGTGKNIEIGFFGERNIFAPELASFVSNSSGDLQIQGGHWYLVTGISRWNDSGSGNMYTGFTIGGNNVLANNQGVWDVRRNRLSQSFSTLIYIEEPSSYLRAAFYVDDTTAANVQYWMTIFCCTF